MLQTNKIQISGQYIYVKTNKEIANKLQELIDELYVATMLLDYEIFVDNKAYTNFDTIEFRKNNKVISINFQHLKNKTSCYCLCNNTITTLDEIKKFI